jgi:branched-chain amino acid aminotransferase
MEPVGAVWMDGELVAPQAATVPLLTHALHYGTGVFDSMRAYPTPAGLGILRHRDHVERLLRSARLYRLPIPYDAEELIDAGRAVVASTGLEAGCYLRPLAFRGHGAMGVSPRRAPVRVAIAAWPWGAYLGEEAAARGIRARVASWRRIDGGSLIPAGKATAHYLNSVLAKLEAEESGCDEAILLDANDLVSEGSGENVFAVAGGRLATPPATSWALGGITRRLVGELAADLGLPVEERPLTRSDLLLADEVFLTGTAAEITPVRELDGVPIGAGDVPGPVTRRLQAAFADAVHGRDPRHLDWLDLVAPEGAAAPAAPAA